MVCAALMGTAAGAWGPQGHRLVALVGIVLLAWALAFNLTQLPYTMWFKVVMFTAFPIACLLGLGYGQRPLSPAASTNPPTSPS